MSSDIAAAAPAPLGDASRSLITQATFDALVTPHRSLGDRGLVVLLVAVLAVSVAVQAAFVALGVWVAGAFVLVDGLFLAAAFFACRADLDRSERVLVADGAVVVERCGRRGAPAVERLPARGLAIEVTEDPDYGCRSLVLRHRGRRIEVARDLSPGERPAFLAAFAAALVEAGHPPRIDRIRSAPLRAD